MSEQRGCIKSSDPIVLKQSDAVWMEWCMFEGADMGQEQTACMILFKAVTEGMFGVSYFMSKYRLDGVVYVLILKTDLMGKSYHFHRCSEGINKHFIAIKI